MSMLSRASHPCPCLHPQQLSAGGTRLSKQAAVLLVQAKAWAPQTEAATAVSVRIPPAADVPREGHSGLDL